MGALKFGYLLGIIIVGCIFGAVTKTMNENKGYYGGFWWGFFLGWIGIVVIACKKENVSGNHYYESEADRALSSYAAEKNNQNLMMQGGWRCLECGRTNASYVTTCICGIPKIIKKKRQQVYQKQMNLKNSKNFSMQVQ